MWQRGTLQLVCVAAGAVDVSCCLQCGLDQVGQAGFTDKAPQISFDSRQQTGRARPIAPYAKCAPHLRVILPVTPQPTNHMALRNLNIRDYVGNQNWSAVVLCSRSRLKFVILMSRVLCQIKRCLVQCSAQERAFWRDGN